MTRFVLISFAVLTAVATFMFAEVNDVGEFSGGELSSRFLLACFLSAPVFLVSATLLLKSSRLSLLTWAIGCTMALPLASLKLFPRLWCAFLSPLPCEDVTYYAYDLHSIGIIAVLMVGAALQIWFVRR